MLPDGFKLFFGLAVYALFGSLAIGVGALLRTTDGRTWKDNLDQVGLMETITGPMSAGWKGSIGNHVGYIVLFGTMLAAFFLAFLLVAFRDADPEAEAQLLQLDSVPLTKAPAGANFSPLIAVGSAALIAGGWVFNTTVFYAGIVLLVLTIGMWTVRAWAERATGDDEVNAAIYHRIVDPLRVPILGLMMIGYLVFGISRVFLGIGTQLGGEEGHQGATVIFLVLGLVLFVALVALGVSGKAPKALIYGLLVVLALAILGFTIYGLSQSDKPSGEGTEQPAHEGGLAPIGPGPVTVTIGAPA